VIAALALMLAAQAAPAAPMQSAPRIPMPEQLDPARLAAAKALLAVTLTPERRARLLDATIAPLVKVYTAQVMALPAAAPALYKGDTAAMAVLERVARAQDARRLERTRAKMPALFTAMERAYARRFTVAQLTELRTFFATPTGQAYQDLAVTPTSDPDLARWYQDLDIYERNDAGQDLRELMTELTQPKGQPQ
jgi:hypothetical protein